MYTCVKRICDSKIESIIKTASFALTENDTGIDDGTVGVPPLGKTFNISLVIQTDGILLNDENTPNIVIVLREMLENSNIWDKLKYKSVVETGIGESSFTIKLQDVLFDIPSFNDLLLSSSEQRNLNNLKTAIVNSVLIKINILNIAGFARAWNTGDFLKDLNYALFHEFISLESKIPLLFNYVSRCTYYAAKHSIPSIVKSCFKSNETYMIEQRAILSGIIKSLSNCPNWIEHVNLWSNYKLKKAVESDSEFTITWFVPIEKDHASL